MSFNFSVNQWFLSRTSTFGRNSELRPSVALNTTRVSGNIDVKVYPRWFKHISVEWSVPSDWGNCHFNVYYGETEDGFFEKLTVSPVNGTYLLDTQAKEYSKFNRGYYVVEAILLDKGSAAIRSVAKTWRPQQNGWVYLRSTEIQRREQILLRKFNGSRTYLFRRKTYGARCPDCWNKELEKITRDNCPTCLGVGFTGGYFDAAPLYVNYDPSPNSLVRTYFGKFEPNEIGGWTISLPEIRPDDVIIRGGDWSVYRVDAVNNTELQGNPVRQMLKLIQLAKTDIENELVTRNLPDFPEEFL